MAVLQPMRYKTFTWPNNPATCQYAIEKIVAKHKYPELAGVELEDMDPECIVLTGNGEFFGPNAYKNWESLNTIFRENGPGEFYHPIFKDINVAIIKNLQANIEPRENYIQYSFEIWQHNPPVVIIAKEPVPTSDAALASSTTGKFNVGDIVIANGYVYRDSYGEGRGIKLVDKQATITLVNYKGTKPVHVGTYGWMAVEDVKSLINTKPTTTSGDKVVTVQSGDTLSAIAKRSGVNWKDVAAYNNIKNPHLIYPGQKIKIKVG